MVSNDKIAYIEVECQGDYEHNYVRADAGCLNYELSEKEIDVLERVLNKFKDFSSKKYQTTLIEKRDMHQQNAGKLYRIHLPSLLIYNPELSESDDGAEREELLDWARVMGCNGRKASAEKML